MPHRSLAEKIGCTLRPYLVGSTPDNRISHRAARVDRGRAACCCYLVSNRVRAGGAAASTARVRVRAAANAADLAGLDGRSRRSTRSGTARAAAAMAPAGTAAPRLPVLETAAPVAIAIRAVTRAGR